MNILKKHLSEQVRTLDKRRLKEKMGHLNERLMSEVNNAIAVSFGLGEGIVAEETVQSTITDGEVNQGSVTA